MYTEINNLLATRNSDLNTEDGVAVLLGRGENIAQLIYGEDGLKAHLYELAVQNGREDEFDGKFDGLLYGRENELAHGLTYIGELEDGSDVWLQWL